ncbi:MAG: metal-dependent hydrolase [Bdellovibrionota bacterium]
MQIYTHAMIGWLISQPMLNRKDRILITTAAMVPDLDAVSLLGGVDAYTHYHHTFGHSALMGALVIPILAYFSRSRAQVAILATLSFASHLIADLLGSGRDWPIPLFWPISSRQFSFSPSFQWELASWQNAVACAACLMAVSVVGLIKRRTVVEVFSVRADKEVVAILRKRFARFI